MALNSFQFLIYFAALFAGLLFLEVVKKFCFPKLCAAVQLIGLLAFSYLVLWAADWRFCLCVLAATVWTYFGGLGITKCRCKKVLMSIGIVGLVAMLGFFKYANFFVQGFSRILGLSSTTLNILLPIGISFYSFSAIAYLVDVYRQKYEAVIGSFHFALYISFFPKLMSGPIVRGGDFFPQAKCYRGIRAKAVADGLQIFVFGLFKKMVLADHLGLFVDDVFSLPSAFHTGSVILAVISYSLQIYFDFSGYSDMSIGLSKMVGFDFKPNFNLPYLATGFSDFWKRWHISLSTWFQDYLYIPLGGSRKGIWRTCINLLIVMTVSGLWHGAGTTFILWGFLHGVVSCLEHILRKTGTPVLGRLWKPLKATGVYAVVTLLWIPFRAESFTNLLAVLKGCFVFQAGIRQPYTWTFFALACFIGCAVYATVKSKKQGLVDRTGCPTVNGFYPLMDLTKFVPLCLFLIFCGLTIILGYFGDTAFIYGQF